MQIKIFICSVVLRNDADTISAQKISLFIRYTFSVTMVTLTVTYTTGRKLKYIIRH